MTTTRSTAGGGFDRTEWDILAGALRARGVPTVAPSRPADGPPAEVSDQALFRRLWSSSDARLRDAAVTLLLVRPDLAAAAAAAARSLEGEARGRAEMGYAAASALQRVWAPRLRWALGVQPVLPDGPVAHLGLPPFDQDFGEAALWELCRREEAAHGYDAWAGYETLVEQLLGELALAPRRRTRA